MKDLASLKKKAFDRWFIIEQSKDKKVLEIGCINHSIDKLQIQKDKGIWLFDYLHNHAAQAVGMDIDREAISYTTKQGYDIRYGDANDFDLGEKFDVIVASKLIDHLANFSGFLSSCQKHLAPDGKIIIADDNILCLPELIRWYFMKRFGEYDDDITFKPIPQYFANFIGRYDLAIKKTIYCIGTGNSRLLNIFRFLARITPRCLIYPPLYYPYYILLLVDKNNQPPTA
ncbi:MAG: methyltransferase domain-containing protein [Patescibacteria group bacterium]